MFGVGAVGKAAVLACPVYQVTSPKAEVPVAKPLDTGYEVSN